MREHLEEFILQNFDQAIERREIQPFYQPVVRTSSRRLCSFEALARWISPEFGVIYPDEFIPVLEKADLIHQLDCSILRQVCEGIRSSIARGETPIPVSVNLSRLDFVLCDIFTIANDIVTEYQIPHGEIYFEITESVMAEQKELLTGIVNRFRAAGYQIWMDDFGSAYSSLNVLKDFIFDELKIDMSFLRPFTLRSRRIVTSVVRMAKLIDIHTLCEGVETEEQFVYLRDIGCEKVQGYYFGKPLPFHEAIANLRAQGIEIESPHERHFYDEIGKIDYLSAVPFAKREEYNAIATAKHLNSIPLALAVFSPDCFKVLFYNAAFEDIVQSSGVLTDVYSQEQLGKPQSYSRLSPNIRNLMDSVKVNGDGRMHATVRDQYYEIKARLMTQTDDQYCVLICVTNLSQQTQSEKTEVLDESARQIYALFDRITLLNRRLDTIRPLYIDTSEDLLSTRHGIKTLLEEYSKKYIFPEDRARYVRIFNPDQAFKRLASSGSISFSELFRTSVRHGQHAWKEYTLLKLDEDNYFMLVRDVHGIAKDLIAGHAASVSESGPYAPAQLWSNLMRSQLIRIFWKDCDRRFLGASQAFLDFYGFSSVKEILGKTDEDLGWHVHPDLFMNDEYKVIHEGVTFQNVHGNCISHGENIEILASKTPLYDVNGEITGLLGYFLDKESLGLNKPSEKSSRRELLTGLLNSRGISEEAYAFQDEYHLRGTDFVRIHISINDFHTINKQHGFDFGDKILKAFGRALRQTFGQKAAVGRYAGRNFTILQQVENKDAAHAMIVRVKEIGESIREIDGNPITLYLSVGFALYSECLDLEKQTLIAEELLQADSGHKAPQPH